MLAAFLYRGVQNQTLSQMQSHKRQADRNNHLSQLLASFSLSKGTLLTHFQLGVHQERDVICNVEGSNAAFQPSVPSLYYYVGLLSFNSQMLLNTMKFLPAHVSSLLRSLRSAALPSGTHNLVPATSLLTVHSFASSRELMKIINAKLHYLILQNTNYHILKRIKNFHVV